MLAKSPADPDVLYQKGVNYFQAKQFDAAIQMFDRILQLNNRDADAWAAKGICLAEQQRYADALPAYRAALDCRPDDPVTLNEMGKVLLNLERHAEAAKAFFDAVGQEPRFAEAWHYLGMALERDGRLDDALGAFDRAVTLDPARADAWHDRGCFFGHEADKYLARRRYRKAIPLLREALRNFECALSVCPGHALASQHRASILDLMGPDFANYRPAPPPGWPTCGDAKETQ
jgi:superkiller protein 3